MEEETERGGRKRISSNPFLYTDGSLVEDDVLQAQINLYHYSTEDDETTSPGPACPSVGVADPDHTPQAEIPSRQIWSQSHTHSRAAASIDIDDDKLQTMTGSYSEILERPLLRQGIAEEKEEEEQQQQQDNEEEEEEEKEELDAVTPVYCEMDPVQAFLSQERLSAFMARDDSLGDLPDYANDSQHDNKDRPLSLKVGRCSPDQAESALQGSGTVTRQGDIISFVADDLHNKIKLASPVAKSLVSFPGSRSSTPSLLRALQFPPIDPSTINDIERHARHIATSVDTLIENLTGTLHSISSLTVDCVETYRDAVCKTCDTVDANIKSMYQLMAKTEELSKSMKTIYKLQEQIKEVRRLLDMFENIIHSCG